MLRSPQFFLVMLALATMALGPSYAQDKNKDPKIVFDLEKPARETDSAAKEPASADGASHPALAQPFGKACSSFGATKDGYRAMDRPFSVAELFGAPIALVTVRRLGAFVEKSDHEELRKHIITVLNAQTVEVSRYADWDEAVPLGIVATIQYSDRSKGILEESGGHVCFSDYSGTVWWLRIPPATKQ